MKPLIKLNNIESFNDAGESNNRSSLDSRDGLIYYYEDNIKLATNVALATGRPLLIYGEPGTGKSSLAFNLARVLKRKYYEVVVTSKSESNELLYKMDAMTRLSDSLKKSHEPEKQVKNNDKSSYNQLDYHPYLIPGVIWWVFDPENAKLKGLDSEQKIWFNEAVDPVIWAPPKGNKNLGSVLLIDEIDKANPEFANDLLVPFGSLQFLVNEINLKVSAIGVNSNEDLPLLIFTSNGERNLPQAFVRRCIVLEINPLEKESLITIALQRFKLQEGLDDDQRQELYLKIADWMAERSGVNRINPAKFFDTIKAVENLKTTEEHNIKKIIDSILLFEKTRF